MMFTRLVGGLTGCVIGSILAHNICGYNPDDRMTNIIILCGFINGVALSDKKIRDDFIEFWTK